MVRKKINYFDQPPKVYVSIVADSDSVVRQTFNVVNGEYYPKRSLVPLVLTPVVGYTIYSSGERKENAAEELSDGHWYRLDNNTQGIGVASELSNNSEGVMIDTAIGSKTYGMLTLSKDVMPGNPETYVFVARLNKGEGVRVSASFRVECDLIEVLPELYFDNDTQGLYNPWDGEAEEFVINPGVSPQGLTATYKWYMASGENWIDIEEGDPLTWALERRNDGVAIKRKVMPDEISLKCVARVKVGEGMVEVERILTHRRRLPAFEYEITRVCDIVGGMTAINPECMLRTYRKKVENPDEEVSVEWLGSGDTVIATGMKPSAISVRSLGEEMTLGLRVSDNGGYKLLTDSDGFCLADADGTLLLTK